MRITWWEGMRYVGVGEQKTIPREKRKTSERQETSEQWDRVE